MTITMARRDLLGLMGSVGMQKPILIGTTLEVQGARRLRAVAGGFFMVRVLHAAVFSFSVLLSGCGGGGASPTVPTGGGSVVLPGNRPPVIESLIASPEFGIADLEVFTFDVKASDPDGDQLTYAWRVEVGAAGLITGNGSRVSVRYSGLSATWNASVVVSDGHGLTTTRSVSATVGSMNGRWAVPSGPFAGASFVLLQSENGTVTGEYLLPGASALERLEGSQVGQITTAAIVTLPLRLGSRSMPFTGTMEKTGRQISGTIEGSPCVLVAQ